MLMNKCYISVQPQVTITSQATTTTTVYFQQLRSWDLQTKCSIAMMWVAAKVESVDSLVARHLFWNS